MVMAAAVFFGISFTNQFVGMKTGGTFEYFAYGVHAVVIDDIGCAAEIAQIPAAAAVRFIAHDIHASEFATVCVVVEASAYAVVAAFVSGADAARFGVAVIAAEVVVFFASADFAVTLGIAEHIKGIWIHFAAVFLVGAVGWGAGFGSISSAFDETGLIPCDMVVFFAARDFAASFFEVTCCAQRVADLGTVYARFAASRVAVLAFVVLTAYCRAEISAFIFLAFSIDADLSTAAFDARFAAILAVVLGIHAFVVIVCVDIVASRVAFGTVTVAVHACHAV